MGVRGSLVFCADYRCSHSIAIGGDRRPDDLRLSDIEPGLVQNACGHRGAESGRMAERNQRLHLVPLRAQPDGALRKLVRVMP